MERVRFYLDNDLKVSIEQLKNDDGKFHVTFVVKDLTAEQAKRVFDYLIRPFFFTSNDCGISINIPSK